MKLQDLKIEKNAWRHKFGNTYSGRTESGELKCTVFEYCIPLPTHREKELELRYGVQNLSQYYLNLAVAVQHQYTIANDLEAANVQSVLRYLDYQTSKNGELTKILLATAPVVPLLGSTITDNLTVRTAIEVTMRLATILRDFRNLDAPVIHRGLNPDEIYVTQDSKILLGGFLYSATPKQKQIPDYLPQKPANLTPVLKAGGVGTQGDDLYSLTAFLWSLLTNSPVGMELPHPVTIPANTPLAIQELIAYGLSGNAEIMAYRKRLTEIRKMLVQGSLQDAPLTVCRKYSGILKKVKRLSTEQENGR